MSALARTFQRLLLRIGGNSARIVTITRSATEHVRAEIVKPSNQRTAAARKRLYGEIVRTYQHVGREADGELKKVVAATTGAVEGQLAEEAVGIAKFSPKYVEEIWETVSPANGRSLAAVFTDKMAEEAVSSLRRSLIEVSRQAALEGKTAAEIEAMIKERWAELAGDERNFQFIDRAGRRWNTDTYVNMLVRTTSQRAYIEAYLKGLVEDGFNYVRLNSFGTEACEICQEWNGRVLRIVPTAEHAELPTVEDARNAGVFHPNCVCLLTYVDEYDI